MKNNCNFHVLFVNPLKYKICNRIRCFCMRYHNIITFVRFMHCYRSRIINSHGAIPAEADQKTH